MRRVSRATGKGYRRPVYSGNTRSVGRYFDRSAAVETDKAPAYGGGDPVVSRPDSGGLILQPENGFRSAERPCFAPVGR